MWVPLFWLLDLVALNTHYIYYEGLLHKSVTIIVYSRDGTTDVTRTLHFGTPTAYQKVYMNKNYKICP